MGRKELGFMRYASICAALLMLIGCASAPAQYDFNPVATIPGDFDAAWAAIVEYFAITNLPIRTIEKASGLVVTDWLDAGVGDEDGPYCDCGGSGLATAYWTRGKFSVFLKEAGAGAVDLRVTCTYQQYRTFMDVDGMVDCNSTGYLEQQLHSYVTAKVEKSSVPDVPTFRPGHSE